MKKFVRRHKIITGLIVFVLLFAGFCVWQNNDIMVKHYKYSNPSISEKLKDYRIVHLSDLHNKDFGSMLVSQVAKQKPNIIVITGDLIDSSNTDINRAMKFVDEAVRIAPVYYVNGNHEQWSQVYDQLRERLLASGVRVLEDTSTIIRYNGAAINLIGIQDPAFHDISADYMDGADYSAMMKVINEHSKPDMPNLLLAHRPSLISYYSESDVDLVLSGHAHGGQFRLPFIGGLVAPDEGLFPTYTSGEHVVSDTTLIISRGLGNSIIPIRIFNRPEVVVITLQ